MSSPTEALSGQVGEGDDALVRVFPAGDVCGFEGLFERYQRPIFNYLYRITGDLAAGEDLTQETFLPVDRVGAVDCPPAAPRAQSGLLRVSRRRRAMKLT